MNCNIIQKMLYDFSKNEIIDKNKNIIKNHINICKKCKSEYEKIKKIKNIFTQNIIAPPNYIWVKIKNKTRQGENIFNFTFNFKTALITGFLIIFIFSGLLFFKNKTDFNNRKELYDFLYNSYNIMEIEKKNDENNYFVFDIYDL